MPLATEICNQWLLLDAGVSEDDDILTGLYEKGWLQFDMEHESYSLHPVFAKFIYEKCRPGIKTHHRLIEACQKYIPFAEDIIEKMDMEGRIEQAKFIDSLAFLLYHIGEYKKSEGLFKKVLLINAKILGKEHPDTYNSYNNLAGLYESQGKYKISLSYYCKAYTIFLHKLGVNHPNTQKVYKNFELAYMAYNPEGDFEQWLEEEMKETE